MAQLLSLSPNLMVADVRRSAEFYQQKLGFKMINSVPADDGYAWAMLQRDSVTIMLHERNNMIDEYSVFAESMIQASMVLYIVVDDVKSFYDNIDSSLIIKDLHKTFYQMEEFSIRDNNGYVLTFAQT